MNDNHSDKENTNSPKDLKTTKNSQKQKPKKKVKKVNMSTTKTIPEPVSESNMTKNPPLNSNHGNKPQLLLDIDLRLEWLKFFTLAVIISSIGGFCNPTHEIII